MAETIGSLQLLNLEITTDSYFMERGPRYYAYARLRESKLRRNFDRNFDPPASEFVPEKKSVRFQGSPVEPAKRRRSSVLGQSVPDFSSAARKENRRPPENRIPRAEKNLATPPRPAAKSGGGSRYANSGEKQSGGKLMGTMTRKSYASMEELKGLSIAASTTINGESKGGKRSNVLRKSAVFSTRYY